MSGVRAMRRALMLLLSLAAFRSGAALGAVSADVSPDAARSAPDRNVQSFRQGQPEPGLRRPGVAGGPRSTTSTAIFPAHAALRQRMLGLVHRPDSVAAVSARRAANVRPMIHTGLGTGGSRQGGNRAVPVHGALGGPTITRSAAKVLSGVQRRPL
jgi:hypothetical protein